MWYTVAMASCLAFTFGLVSILGIAGRLNGLNAQYGLFRQGVLNEERMAQMNRLMANILLATAGLMCLLALLTLAANWLWQAMALLALLYGVLCLARWRLYKRLV